MWWTGAAAAAPKRESWWPLDSLQLPGLLVADATPTGRQRRKVQLAQLRPQQLDARDEGYWQLCPRLGARDAQPPQRWRQPQRLQQRRFL